MSHGYYPEGDGPGTDALEHEQGCGCAECQYQREQMFQDLREEQEREEAARAKYETYHQERGH